MVVPVILFAHRIAEHEAIMAKETLPPANYAQN